MPHLQYPRSSHAFGRLLVRLGAALAVAVVVGLSAARVGAQAVDDNIPNAVGYTWGTSQTGSLDYASGDTDDVFRIDLKKGQVVDIKLTGSSGSDFDIYLFDPDAVNILEDQEVASSETKGTSSESIKYTAAKTGTYNLDVATWDTKGDYTLVIKVRPIVSLSATKSIYDYQNNSGVTLKGALDPARATVRVDVQSQPAGGGSFSTAGHAQTDTTGKFSFALKPTRTATYRISWSGDAAFLSATSRDVVVKVKPALKDWKTSPSNINTSESTSTNKATVSGRLVTTTGLPAGQSVTIQRSTGGGTPKPLGVVHTNGKGGFSYVFTSGTPGTFYVQAVYKGEKRWTGLTSGKLKIVVSP